MVTVKQLENQRRKEIQSLKPSEITSYIDSLVKRFTDSFLRYDIDGMNDFNDKLDELYELVGHKVNNLGNVVNSNKMKYIVDVVMFYRVKELVSDVNLTIGAIRRYDYNVFYDSLILIYLLRTVHEVYHETKSESIKKFDFIIGLVYRNYLQNIQMFQSSLNKLEYYNKDLVLFLEGVKEAISDNPFIKDYNLLESYDNMLNEIESFIEDKKKYHNDLKYKFQWLEEENPFDDISLDSFYDFLFEKYPFMLELDEDSDEYKEKAKEIPLGLLEPFMKEEPQYILSDDKCSFVLPSEVEDLTDSMKELIKEIESEGYF